MSVHTLQTSSSPVVFVKAGGDLRVTVSDQQQVHLMSDDGPGKLAAEPGGEIRAICPGDGDLTVPAQTRLTVDRVSGDAAVEGLIGALVIQSVGGDVSLKQVASVDIQTVGGDLALTQVAGNAHINRVGGELTGEDVFGGLAADVVGGDVVVNGVAGACSASVGGDFILRLTTVQTCKVRAGGDIILHLPENANAHLNVKSGGNDIQLQLGGQSQSLRQPRLDQNIGSGGDEISLLAGGDVRITDAPSKEFGGTKGSLHRTIDFMNDEIREAITRGMKKAGINPEKINLEGSGENIVPPPSPEVHAEPAAATDEDADARLMILRMLQDKKISAEEAERLLEAMDGEIPAE
ncbi:MAG: hypothetical protein ABFD44_03240 [Anaerolineaceae bacterium]